MSKMMGRHGTRRLGVAIAALLAATTHAWAGESQDKWGGHIDLEGKAGTDRHLGEIDLFLPMSQDDDNLLFASIRTRMDDAGGREGNFGLGLRHMREDGWNVGGYGYFDRRLSDYDNFFNQITLGAEVLGRDWDGRVNAYVPLGTTHHDVDSLNTAQVSGASVIFRGGEEYALGGFDAEIGRRLPVFDEKSGTTLRIYGGGYRFRADTSGVPDVTGPRGRLELSFELPQFSQGTRFSLGAEVQHDDPRGSQSFLSARLRIPFGGPTRASRLTLQERRMTDPIVRDIDIVSQAGAYGTAETASQLANGTAFTVINSETTTTAAALNTALTTAGDNSTVLLSGNFSTNATINLRTGQTVQAGSISVRSASGRIATVNMPSSITTQAGTATNSVNMLNNSTLSGLTISNTATGAGAVFGISAQGRSGVVIADNTVNVSGGTQGAIGIDARTTTNAVVRNNTIQATATTAGAIAIQATVTTTNLTVAGNSLSASGSVSYAFQGNNNTTVNAASTGNILVQGVCNGGPYASGSVTFTNGTVCQ